MRLGKYLPCHRLNPPLSIAELHRHLTALFAPGLDLQSFRERSARILRELIGCRVVSFALFEPATRHLQIDFDPFMPELQAGLPVFAKHMAKYPCFNFDPAVAGGKAFLRGDFLSDDEFYRSAIYRESFAVAGFTDHAAMLLPTERAGHVFFVGMERSGGTYGPADRARLRFVQPHFGHAALLAESLASLEKAIADPAAFTRAGLSAREAEVLVWLAQGKGNAEITQILGIKLTTVKTHIMRIFDKLGVGNRHEAILRAHELARLGAREAPSPGMRRLSARAAKH